MRILLAVDGSACSETARDFVAGVKWPSQSVIRVMSVTEPANILFGTPWAPTVVREIDALEAELASHTDSILEAATRVVARTGCSIERQVVRGRPASAIVEEASGWPADVIVMGNRGHGTIATMLLGSVTAEVVDHAPCPVLVARLPQLTRVVLAHDGSSFARAAEDLVASWPMFRTAAVEVVSVAPGGAARWPGSALSAGGEMAGAEKAGEVTLEEFTAIAGESAARLGRAGRRAEPVVIRGQPAAGIIDVADAKGAEMIALGTHGRTGLTRILLGSVARNVMIHARCSVLVARQPAID